LCPESLREEIEAELARRNYLKEGETLAPMRIYKSLERMDFDLFADTAGEAVSIEGGSSVTVPGS